MIGLLVKQKNKVIKFIHIQLFITLVSIPILLCWGIPISLLTFAGNFFFTPILTAFLFFSSLIFFCQLLHIPNGIFIYCLEHITHWWLWIMHWGTKRCLVALPLPTIAIIIAIPLLALGILHHKKINTPLKSITWYGLLLVIIYAYLKLMAPTATTIDTLDCNKGIVTSIMHKKQLVLIDPGVIGRRLSAPSWCEYTLMPYLVKKYGTTTIDHLIVLQPNKIIFDALISLLEKVTIKNIYLPLWDGKLPLYWWRAYAHLRDVCKRTDCKLIRVAKKPLSISLNDFKICITPLEKQITMDEFNYPVLQVQANIDNYELTLYSAKHKL